MTTLNFADSLTGWLRDRGVPSAVCGGAVRDTLLNRPIRDIDVYVQNGYYPLALKFMFGDVPVAEGKQDTEAYVHQSVERQQECDVDDTLARLLDLPTPRINVIGIAMWNDSTPAQAVIERYNLGICKAGIDHNGLCVDADFWKDQADRQITLLRVDWGYEATLKQFIKLQAK